jgi:hypothetical protein
MTEIVHEIHSSELRAYRQCRQYWDWRHRENWEPVKKPAPLEDGTVWHKAMEVLYDPETWTRPLEELHNAAHAALVTEAIAQRKAYLERAGKYQLDNDEAQEYADRMNLLISMLGKLCRTLDREQYRPISVEQEFSCPIKYPDDKQMTCLCHACRLKLAAAHDLNYSQGETVIFRERVPVVFVCRIDTVFEDREGYIYAVDHKSTASLLKEDSVIPELEDQLPLYLWCLRENGYPVTGMILNQFRKSAPHPPKELERGQQGRMFSVNRMQLTDVYTARNTFRTLDARAYKLGLYDDYLAWLTEFGPQYSRQFLVIKTPEQLEIIGDNLRLQVQELIDSGPSVYPNPSRINCNQCTFQLPCFSKQSKQNYQVELDASFIKSEPYYVVRRRQT